MADRKTLINSEAMGMCLESSLGQLVHTVQPFSAREGVYNEMSSPSPASKDTKEGTRISSSVDLSFQTVYGGPAP